MAKEPKVYANIKIDGACKLVRGFAGYIKQEDFELILDLMDIVWQPEYNYRGAYKRALKKIKGIVSTYNKEIEELF